MHRHPDETPSANAHAFTILVVDDDRLMLEVTQGSVEDLGYDVITAGAIDEAQRILESAQPIDALLTDIRLNADKLGGYRLARDAIALRPDLRVCYMTGDAMTEETRASFVAGAHYLQKPYRVQSLAGALQSLFEIRARGLQSA